MVNQTGAETTTYGGGIGRGIQWIRFGDQTIHTDDCNIADVQWELDDMVHKLTVTFYIGELEVIDHRLLNKFTITPTLPPN